MLRILSTFLRRRGHRRHRKVKCTIFYASPQNSALSPPPLPPSQKRMRMRAPPSTYRLCAPLSRTERLQLQTQQHTSHSLAAPRTPTRCWALSSEHPGSQPKSRPAIGWAPAPTPLSGCSWSIRPEKCPRRRAWTRRSSTTTSVVPRTLTMSATRVSISRRTSPTSFCGGTGPRSQTTAGSWTRLWYLFFIHSDTRKLFSNDSCKFWIVKFCWSIAKK